MSPSVTLFEDLDRPVRFSLITLDEDYVVAWGDDVLRIWEIHNPQKPQRRIPLSKASALAMHDGSIVVGLETGNLRIGNVSGEDWKEVQSIENGSILSVKICDVPGGPYIVACGSKYVIITPFSSANPAQALIPFEGPVDGIEGIDAAILSNVRSGTEKQSIKLIAVLLTTVGVYLKTSTWPVAQDPSWESSEYRDYDALSLVDVSDTGVVLVETPNTTFLQIDGHSHKTLSWEDNSGPCLDSVGIGRIVSLSNKTAVIWADERSPSLEILEIDGEDVAVWAGKSSYLNEPLFSCLEARAGVALVTWRDEDARCDGLLLIRPEAASSPTNLEGATESDFYRPGVQGQVYPLQEIN